MIRPTARNVHDYVQALLRADLGREPNNAEIAAGCAGLAAIALDGMSAGYLRLPPVGPTREAKEPPKVVA